MLESGEGEGGQAGERTVAGNEHANKLTIARPIFQPFPHAGSPAFIGS